MGVREESEKNAKRDGENRHSLTCMGRWPGCASVMSFSAGRSCNVTPKRHDVAAPGVLGTAPGLRQASACSSTSSDKADR